jgi:tetratricopeptide (TPR) repeat protein
MEAAGRLRAEGKLMQAARELRRLLDIVPGDQAAREELQQLERLLGEKRACAMELRNLVASSRYEEALARWESLDVVLRDDQLATQMTHLAQTVVPSMRNADKGDAEARAGRMDSALRLYEEALKQDAGNEKAKLGIKNIERTRQRIQVLLKDGYTCRQHRDYEQAVQIWAKILDVEPQNSQALRLIVEAHLAVANEAFGAEDFDRALRHCEALLTLVPGNKEAVQLQTNATVLRDRVSELRRTAEMARNRGDLSGTAKAYRELTAIIPKSKVARAGLDSTRKALAHHRSKRLLLLLLLVAVVASGFLFWQDYVRVAEARRYWEAQEFARAREAAAHVHFPWLRTEAREIMGKASLDQSLAEATAAQKEGRWADAASALRSAVALSSADAKRTYSLQLMRCEYQHAVSLGRKAEDGGRWDEAQGEYLKAYNVARGANSLAYDSMKGEEEKAERDRLFCAYMAEGSRMEAAGNRIEALGNFGKARGYRSDSDLVDRKIKELSTVSPP